MPRGPIPAELAPEHITALVDSREQYPLDLSPMPMVQLKADAESSGLSTGDYSVLGFEHLICVERKSLDDLLACVGRERERFDRCIQRMLAYPHRVIVIEATEAQLRGGEWRSQVTPAAVVGSIRAWNSRGVRCVPAGSHKGAENFVRNFLVESVKPYYRSVYKLLKPVASQLGVAIQLPAGDADPDPEIPF